MDVLMSEGAPESIIRIGIALLMRNKDQILAMEDFESTMKVLNNELYNDESCLRDRPGFVLQEAAKLSAVVTQQRLEQLEAQYCKEQGVVLKGRQSMSVDDNTSANADSSSVNANGSRSSSNHAIMNFLGWPWGNSNNNSSSASSIASTPHPVSSAAVGSKWKFGNLGKNLATPSNDGEEYSDSIGSEDRSYISPKALELTESQKQYSRQLREQMLQSLLTQDNTPATMLGSISSLQANSSNSRDSADSNTTNTVVTPKRTSLDIELNGDSATPVVSRQKSKSSMDNAWRDEVLEPLQRQLYDARVTCDSHRDALVALQKEHESLQGDLATVKMSYAELAEQNDQLRMMLRKLETERNKHQEEAAYHLERTQRSEEALIRARIDLADADEEKAALKKQISNLRKFVNDTSTSSMPSGTLNQQPPMRSRIMSADSGTLPLLNPAAVANSSNGGNNGNNRQQGRFSISTIASNWSAFRGSIVSPRSSMQQDSAVSSPAVPPSTGGGDDTASLMSVTSASLSPQINRRVSIPLTSLHRSKTVTSVTSNPNAKAPSHLGDQAAVPGGSPSLSSSSSRSPASGTQGDAH
ncbi:hypothetical protein GGI12_005514 [Dipsacomyces acuminosporus]|nr:hypothetical protein GGI12_005514 [Dipsacomyces acuminosporus]